MESWEWAEPSPGDDAQPTMNEVAHQPAPFGQQPFGQQPFGQPANTPFSVPDYEITGSPVLEKTPSGRIAKRLVAGLGAIGLIGGATFTVRTFASEQSNTPTQAVQSMMAAAQKSDVLGMMEQLAPGERNLLIEKGVPILEELKRLTVLAPTANLNAIDGAKVSFAGQTFTESALREDIATVKVSGGTITTSSEAAKLFGDSMQKSVGPNGIPSKPPKTTNFKTASVATIKRNGHWYVSIAYSVAEAARLDSGKPMPTKEQSITATGADTPELALRQMIEAAGALDARKAISLLDPDEFGAVQDYAPLFIDEIEKSAAEVRPHYTISFPNLQIAATADGKIAKAKITNMSMDLTIKDIGDMPVRAIVDGDCISITLKEKTSKRCGSEVGKLLSDFSEDPNIGPTPFGVDVYKLDQKNQQATTIVQRNGKWFVAPMRTVLDAVLAKMKSAKPSDVQGDLGPLGLLTGNPLSELIGGKVKVKDEFSTISNTLPDSTDGYSSDADSDPYSDLNADPTAQQLAIPVETLPPEIAAPAPETTLPAPPPASDIVSFDAG
jgi:hypothetical protein